MIRRRSYSGPSTLALCLELAPQLMSSLMLWIVQRKIYTSTQIQQIKFFFNVFSCSVFSCETANFWRPWLHTIGPILWRFLLHELSTAHDVIYTTLNDGPMMCDITAIIAMGEVNRSVKCLLDLYVRIKLARVWCSGWYSNRTKNDVMQLRRLEMQKKVFHERKRPHRRAHSGV